MANLVGQQLGNYRIVRLLGQGAFADVYLAKHLHLNTKVAIKVLHTKLTRDERDGFLTEARILSLLAHPHIVRVLDYAVEDGSPYLVMEYALYGTLRQRHPDSSPLPLDTVISYVTQVASALQYAHDEKLIHRDVKPENLLVGKDHKILLSDFGFVTVSLSSRTEKVQDIAGTMAYMAPEQIQAHPSRASDQYALGIVIYEWLCGKRPFDGTLEEIAAKHMTVAPPSLHERNSMLSPIVEMVVMRALEKDPSKRFASIREFAAAFEQACTLGLSAVGWREFFRRGKPSRAKVGNPDMPEPNVSTSSVMPFFSNEVYSAFMNQPVLGVVGGSGKFGLAGGFSANSDFSIQFSAGPAFSQDHSVQVVALSPDGKSVAFGGWSEAIYVYHLAEEGKSFTYSGHSDRVFQLAWSPDGKFLASVSNDNTVQVWNAATGDTVFTYEDHHMNFGTLAWSPDSIRIASAIGDEVHVWDAITGTTLLTYHGHPKLVVTLAWSPDGKRIASSSKDGAVQVWDISTGSIMCAYYGHIDRVCSLAWSPDGACIVSGGDNCSVQVWNATNRRHILTTRSHSHPRGVLLVGWSVDGKRLRVGYYDGFVEELDATTGNHVSFFHTQGLSGTFVNT
ncbi:MAG TPA: serine/threonine-protein kinase, partial [Ktedonobacteraceae bacterium]|nr:serine/threonine-protein kinase [Ktedonobacteraceae bacterium]